MLLHSMAVFRNTKSLIRDLTWEHVLRQLLLFILLIHKENVEIKIASLLINEYLKLFFSTNYVNRSKCQWYTQQEQCNNSTSFSKDMPMEAWGLLHVPKFWIATPTLPCLSPCMPYSSPPKTSSCIQSTCP